MREERQDGDYIILAHINGVPALDIIKIKLLKTAFVSINIIS